MCVSVRIDTCGRMQDRPGQTYILNKPTDTYTHSDGRPWASCVYLCLVYHESSNPEHGHTRHMKITWWSMSPNHGHLFLLCWKVAGFLCELIEGRWGRHGMTMNSNWSASHFFYMSDMWTRQTAPETMPTHMQQDQASTHSIHFNPVMKFRIGMNLVHFGSFWCWLWLFAAQLQISYFRSDYK